MSLSSSTCLCLLLWWWWWWSILVISPTSASFTASKSLPLSSSSSRSSADIFEYLEGVGSKIDLNDQHFRNLKWLLRQVKTRRHDGQLSEQDLQERHEDHHKEPSRSFFVSSSFILTTPTMDNPFHPSRNGMKRRHREPLSKQDPEYKDHINEPNKSVHISNNFTSSTTRFPPRNRHKSLYLQEPLYKHIRGNEGNNKKPTKTIHISKNTTSKPARIPPRNRKEFERLYHHQPLLKGNQEDEEHNKEPSKSSYISNNLTSEDNETLTRNRYEIEKHNHKQLSDQNQSEDDRHNRRTRSHNISKKLLVRTLPNHHRRYELKRRRSHSQPLLKQDSGKISTTESFPISNNLAPKPSNRTLHHCHRHRHRNRKHRPFFLLENGDVPEEFRVKELLEEEEDDYEDWNIGRNKVLQRREYRERVDDGLSDVLKEQEEEWKEGMYEVEEKEEWREGNNLMEERENEEEEHMMRMEDEGLRRTVNEVEVKENPYEVKSAEGVKDEKEDEDTMLEEEEEGLKEMEADENSKHTNSREGIDVGDADEDLKIEEEEDEEGSKKALKQLEDRIRKKTYTKGEDDEQLDNVFKTVSRWHERERMEVMESYKAKLHPVTTQKMVKIRMTAYGYVVVMMTCCMVVCSVCCFMVVRQNTSRTFLNHVGMANWVLSEFIHCRETVVDLKRYLWKFQMTEPTRHDDLLIYVYHELFDVYSLYKREVLDVIAQDPRRQRADDRKYLDQEMKKMRMKKRKMKKWARILGPLLR